MQGSAYKRWRWQWTSLNRWATPPKVSLFTFWVVFSWIHSVVRKMWPSILKNQCFWPRSCPSLKRFVLRCVIYHSASFCQNILNINEGTTLPPRKKRRTLEDDDLASQAAYFTEATTSAANLEQVYVAWTFLTTITRSHSFQHSSLARPDPRKVVC